MPCKLSNSKETSTFYFRLIGNNLLKQNKIQKQRLLNETLSYVTKRITVI